jgi:AraC-like DNA-binding protein
MLLYTSLLGVILSLILLWFNGRTNRSTIYLGVFFLLFSLYAFYQYVLLEAKSVLLVEMMLVGFVLVTPPLYLIGPSLYFYVRSILTDKFNLKKRDLWHLLPALIYFIAALPYTFVPFAEKAEAAHAVVKDIGYMQFYKATFLSDIFPTSVVFLSRPVLVLGYTMWSGILLFRYLSRNKLTNVFSGQRFMKIWVALLLVTMFILVLSQTILIRKVFDMHFSELAFTLNVLRVLSVISLFVLLISPFFFPAILYGLPRIPLQHDIPSRAEEKPCVTEAEEKTSTVHLENNYLQCISERIDSYMESHEPYLQSQFNINQLSVETSIPAHHLGYYFREIKKESFTEYRNRWRILHAKKLIAGGRMNEFTLEAIAELSGFTNRNSFRTTFQRVEGVPPSIYAAQVKNKVQSRVLDTI